MSAILDKGSFCEACVIKAPFKQSFIEYCLCHIKLIRHLIKNWDYLYPAGLIYYDPFPIHTADNSRWTTANCDLKRASICTYMIPT